MGSAGAASLTPSIKAEGLTKAFGSRQTLRGIDLAVNPGESVVIFGPNGAGKTTLLKILATIMNPSSGKVFICGLDAKARAEEARRQIGIVTHHTFLYGNLTAYENLDFYGRLYDVPDRHRRICELVETVGLSARMHHRVGTFSRGMQQRISIARALLHKPSIMLLDEAETGLDRQAIALVWDVLRTQEGQKRTILLTTHNLERGLEVSERVIVLDRGKIVSDVSKRNIDMKALEKVFQSSAESGL